MTWLNKCLCAKGETKAHTLKHREIERPLLSELGRRQMYRTCARNDGRNGIETTTTNNNNT